MGFLVKALNRQTDWLLYQTAMGAEFSRGAKLGEYVKPFLYSMGGTELPTRDMSCWCDMKSAGVFNFSRRENSVS